jgi:hypothetical protein
MYKPTKFPIRYVPFRLTKKDKTKQAQMLIKSKKLYKKGKYFTRKLIKSFQSKPSKHTINARKIYNVRNIVPSRKLSSATGCSIKTLKKIVNKGAGAYYSSGSRPNQTAQSWGLARLASSISGGKAAAVDYGLIENGCDHKKKAFILANKARELYNYGLSKTHKVIVK